VAAEHDQRTGQQTVKRGADRRCIGTRQLRWHGNNVVKRPTSDHAVKGQNQEAGQRTEVAKPFPAAADFRLPGQLFHGIDRTQATTAPHHHLGHHNRDAHQQNDQQVHQDKGTTTVLASNVGKLPEIPEADRRARRCQNKHPATGPPLQRCMILFHKQLAQTNKGAIFPANPVCLKENRPPTHDAHAISHSYRIIAPL